MARISFMVVEKTLCQTTAYCNLREGANIKQQNCLKSSCRIILICSATYSDVTGFFFHLFFQIFAISINCRGLVFFPWPLF